uniref:Uncharacterized protein n=1 Tax=Anopheles culicifacies TaxID=139723 RepID=A0A182MNZ5_9DIPT
MARLKRLEMMEQRPHRCITPSTDPWRELDDCRLAEEGSTVAPPDEEVATVVVFVVAVVFPPPAPVLSVVVVVVVAVGARRPSDAEVPRDLFDAATLTAFAKPYAATRCPLCFKLVTVMKPPLSAHYGAR